MRLQVLHVADRVVATGELRNGDASLLNTVHQRVVNYLDWVSYDDAHQNKSPDRECLAAAQRLLQCIESTVMTADATASGSPPRTGARDR